MQDILQQIAASPEETEVDLLVSLVSQLRPKKATAVSDAENNLLALAYLLEHDATLRRGLRRYLHRVLETRHQVHLYTDLGILANTGFIEAAKQRFVYKVLPPVINDDYLKDVFGRVFYRKDDHVWIADVANATWLRLLDALFLDPAPEEGVGEFANGLLEAILILSYRITTIGLEPELVRNYPAIEHFESPFIRQNDEVTAFLNAFRRRLAGESTELPDARPSEVLLDQCYDVAERISRNAKKNGVSVSLTYLLQRLKQSLERMNTLITLLQADSSARREAAVDFFKELVAADNRKYSLRDLISVNTELLARRVTENAGKTGEHYVTSDRAGYVAMARSALGAGFIASFMALFKILAAKLKLAPLGEALVYGLNYSLGFMLIHVLHFTVATKQPAMTATRIALSLERGSTARRGEEARLEGLAELTRDVFRTQFVAICGNVLIALPMAALLAMLFSTYGEGHLVSPEKAQALLQSVDIFGTPALFYAATAGVCLFLSGVISGYYDNKAAYSRLPERLRQLRWLRAVLGAQRLQRLTDYIGNNTGALAGNFFFGLMLGGIPTLGFLLGLPLDIRHITFSSANVGTAIVALDGQVAWPQIAGALAGIAGIGLTNLIVSFGLALMVALRSRGVRYRRWVPLALLIGKSFLREPLLFFWPPKPERAGKETTVVTTAQ